MKRAWIALMFMSLVVVGCRAIALSPEEPGTHTLAPTPVSPTATPLEPSPATPQPAEPAPETVLSPGRLSGLVRDAEAPVEGATVRVQLTEIKTTTAADGSFFLADLLITEPVSVTAWAAGYYVGGATARPSLEPVTITLKPHYTTDNLDYEWFTFNGIEGSASCAPCHTAYAEWQADAHSQAAVNPRFLTMYEGTDVQGNKSPQTQYGASGALPPDPSQPYYGPGYKVDYPNRLGNCAACHTPLADNLDPNDTCGWSGCHTELTGQRSPSVPDPIALPSDQYGVSPLGLTGDAADGVGCDFCHKIGDVILDPDTGLPYADKPGISSMRLYRPPEGQQIFFGTYDDVTRRVTYLPLEEESAFCAPCHYGVFSGVVGSGEVAGGVIVYNSYGEWLASPYSDPESGQTCQDCHMLPVDNGYFVYPEQGGLRRDYKPVHDHYMPGASDEALLQNSVTMTATAQLDGDTVLVEVSITNDKTGHHVPTGTPLRHMILIVQVTGVDGNLLSLNDGPVLPDWTGDYANLPGRYYAKVLEDLWTGESPTAAYWRDICLVEDTRLAAFATDVSRYAFAVPAEGSVIVQAKLVFRRAFQHLMEWKSWDDADILMEEATIVVAAP